MVDPLKIITGLGAVHPHFRWEPSRGASSRSWTAESGKVTRLEADPLFTFDHVNAFERDGKIYLDLCGYDDADVIDALYLDRLRGRRRPSRLAELRRYELDLGRKRVRMRQLAEPTVELPRINYARVNGRPYRYAYGISVRDYKTSGYVDQLVKVDVKKGRREGLAREGLLPGRGGLRALAALAPRGRRRGAPVVLDARRRRSFLLVLDARSFTEIARAEVSHHILYGFHGELFEDLVVVPAAVAGAVVAAAAAAATAAALSSLPLP